jgi:FAD/FMN-containing dehydrogenase
MLSDPIVGALRSRLRGRLLTNDDPAYDGARRVFNAMIDRRPALIARCEDVNDVIACVAFAREHDLLVSVRGGGHSVAGKAVCDGGLMIDLSAMKGIHVDPARQTVRAETGLTLGEFDRATQLFGLATTLGIVSGTGIAGLTLGGGIGWLNGKYGLACDNVISFDIVTAEPRLLRANAAVHEDLYWALRGGSGNFGVVTAIEYQLYRVGPVLAGPVFHPLDRAKDALRFFVDFSSEAPDELTTMAGLVTLPNGVAAAVLAVCYCGSIEDGERVVGPLRSFGAPIGDQIQPMSYVALQSMLDDFFPVGHQHYWKSNLTSRVPDEVLDMMIDFTLRKPSSFTIAGLQALHGVAGRVPAGHTAFPHRGNRFDCLILSQWPNPADTVRNISWTREFYASVEPHLDAAVYLNNLGEEPDAVVRAAFGANYERLSTIKRNYDPTNFFRSVQNIRPKPDAVESAAGRPVKP